MHATSDFHPAVIHTEFFEGRPMDILLAEIATDIAAKTTAELTGAPVWRVVALTAVARHRLSDEEPDPDEVEDPVDDDDDDDDDDWEDLDDDDWDDDDDDLDLDDDDDDDDDEPANTVITTHMPVTARSS